MRPIEILMLALSLALALGGIGCGSPVRAAAPDAPLGADGGSDPLAREDAAAGPPEGGPSPADGPTSAPADGAASLDAAGDDAAAACSPDDPPARGVPYPLVPCADMSDPADLAVVADRLIFSAISFHVPGWSHYYDLWLSDGTPGGTAPLRGPYDHANSQFGEFTGAGGGLYFLASLYVDHWGLWFNDWSAATTVDLDPDGDTWHGPGGLTTLGTTAYWTDGTNGVRLYGADGSKAGIIATINPTLQSDYVGLSVSGGALYFAADDGTHGSELWRSDGTGAGTSLVVDLAPGLPGSAPEDLHDHLGTLFFFADDGGGGGLWRSDGTAAGTRLVTRLRSIAQMATVGARLVLVADDGVHGDQLFASDGTPGGTGMVRLINPQGSAAPGALTVVSSDRVFFFADDGSHGAEPWQSDGTAAGTALVADLVPGPGGSYPGSLAAYHGSLFFGAGQQLYRLDP
jgi:ELWxxDGT repeat protein